MFSSAAFFLLRSLLLCSLLLRSFCCVLSCYVLFCCVLSAAISPTAFSLAVFFPAAFSPTAFSPAAFCPAAFSPAALSLLLLFLPPLSLRRISDMGHIYSPIVLCPGVRRNHSVPDCHLLRGRVGIPDNRTDRICLQHPESILLAGGSCFRSIASVPACALKKVADFQQFLPFHGCMVRPHCPISSPDCNQEIQAVFHNTIILLELSKPYSNHMISLSVYHKMHNMATAAFRRFSSLFYLIFLSNIYIEKVFHKYLFLQLYRLSQLDFLNYSIKYKLYTLCAFQFPRTGANAPAGNNILLTHKQPLPATLSLKTALYMDCFPHSVQAETPCNGISDTARHPSQRYIPLHISDYSHRD